MADNNADLPDINFEEADAAPAVRTTPLTLEERIIVQNLFDTQPKRRKQYMEQLGFELDPNDTNKYRPMGSQSDFQAEIDPGVSFYFKSGGLAEKFKELGKDGVDLVGDSVQSIISSFGQKAGAKAGMAAGGASPPTQAIGAVLGGITGGVLGQAFADEAKEHIGNIYLDKNIPDDKKLRAMSALIAGVAPVAIQGLGKGANAIKSGFLAQRAQAISAAAKSAGGGVTDDLLVKATKNPEMFTPEAVKGATERLGGIYKSIFGVAEDKVITPKSTRAIAPDSVFGKAVKPLNEQADMELNRLASEPAANWKASDLIGPINSKIDELASKFSRSSEEEAALKYMRDKKAFLQGKAKESLAKAGRPVKATEDALMAAEFNFKEGRQFLKTVQDDAFNREIPGNTVLAQYAGGLRQAADAKAGAMGSKLPEINAKRAEILGLFDQAKATLSPQKLTQAFIGDDQITKDQTKLLLQNLEKAGVAPGISTAVETGALQRILDNAYTNKKAFGSGRVAGAMMTEGAAGAARGAGLGAAAGSLLPGVSTGAGAGIGAVGGFVQGAKRGALMARPEVAIPALVDNIAKQRALEAAMAAPLQQQASQFSQAGGQAALRNIAAPETLPAQEPDLPDIEW